ncbi:MAG: hypothetical protein ACYS47_05625 [Planctomycetota bacterium]
MSEQAREEAVSEWATASERATAWGREAVSAEAPVRERVGAPAGARAEARKEGRAWGAALPGPSSTPGQGP